MSKIVIDSSAFLAVANREPGAERVYPILNQALLSAVNAAEVLQQLVKKGMSAEKADEYVSRFVNEVVAFDYEQAKLASTLILETQSRGLSLGDRACLALGKSLNALVLTADQAWAKLDIGVQIELIRPRLTIS